MAPPAAFGQFRRRADPLAEGVAEFVEHPDDPPDFDDIRAEPGYHFTVSGFCVLAGA